MKLRFARAAARAREGGGAQVDDVPPSGPSALRRATGSRASHVAHRHLYLVYTKVLHSVTCPSNLLVSLHSCVQKLLHVDIKTTRGRRHRAIVTEIRPRICFASPQQTSLTY